MGQAVLEAAILPQPSKSWGSRGVPPGLACSMALSACPVSLLYSLRAGSPDSHRTSPTLLEIKHSSSGDHVLVIVAEQTI